MISKDFTVQEVRISENVTKLYMDFEDKRAFKMYREFCKTMKDFGVVKQILENESRNSILIITSGYIGETLKQQSIDYMITHIDAYNASIETLKEELSRRAETMIDKVYEGDIENSKVELMQAYSAALKARTNKIAENQAKLIRNLRKELDELGLV